MMKPIIRALQRIFGQKTGQIPPYHFAHQVSWLKEARAWIPAERTRVRAAVEKIVLAPRFTRTQYQRHYALPEMGQREYAGESLVALLEVLESLDHQNTQEE